MFTLTSYKFFFSIQTIQTMQLRSGRVLEEKKKQVSLVERASDAAKTFQKEVQVKAKTRSRVIVVVDVEGMGARMTEHPILAFGYVVGRLDKYQILEKKRYALKVPADAKFEPRCADQYWKQHPEKLAAFERDAVDPKIALGAFVQMLRQLEAEHEHVYLVTDTPGYDIEMLDYALQTSLHPAHHPLLYHASDQQTYRGVLSCEEMAVEYRKGESGQFIWQYNQQRLESQIKSLSTVPHDHWPDNDAENTYARTWIMCHEPPTSPRLACFLLVLFFGSVFLASLSGILIGAVFF